MAVTREQDLDCQSNSCRFGGRGKGGMRTNGRCTCIDKLIQMLAEKDAHITTLLDTSAVLKTYQDTLKMLAEKDREIEQLKEGYQFMMTAKQVDCDLLMHQAVQFAEILESIANAYGRTGIETTAFLSTPEVQAYQAQQNNGLVKGCHRSHPHEEMSETCILRSSLAKKDLEINRLQATIEKLLRLKALIERAYRGYGTPEQEVAKKQAQQKSV
jgi:hypothetical protein